MRILVILVILTVVGCDSGNNYHRSSYIKCTCPVLDRTSYVINMEFYDHDLKERMFPYTISVSEFGFIPNKPLQSIYETKGISVDGTNSWYYSIKPPERLNNGLLKIEQLDGPHIMVDYKDIEVTMKPCWKSVKSNPIADDIEAEWEAARIYRNKKCKGHNY